VAGLWIGLLHLFPSEVLVDGEADVLRLDLRPVTRASHFERCGRVDAVDLLADRGLGLQQV
jgi:hypothetical protein